MYDSLWMKDGLSSGGEIVWNFWNFYLEKYFLDFPGLYLVLTALPLLLKSKV